MDPAISRVLADRIPNARLAQIGEVDDPADVGWWHWYGRSDAILREIGVLLEDVRRQNVVFDRVLATVLFTDIVDSTERAAALGDQAWKTWSSDTMHSSAIIWQRIRGARSIRPGTASTRPSMARQGPRRALRPSWKRYGALGIEVRAGLHTGEVATVAGKSGGIAVVIGSRVAAMAGPSEVLATQTVKDLTAGSGLTFEDAGDHELKGVPDRWHLYRVMSGHA